MPFRGKRSNRPRLNKTRKNRRTKKVSNAIKLYVKKAIHSNEENKVFIRYGINQSLVTAVGTVPTFVYLTPYPTQGTGQSNRVGNQIKCVKAFIRGHVNLLPYNALSNPSVGPVIVKMWLCSCKTVNTATLATTQIDTNFFETNNTTAGFQGNMLDAELSQNKDIWTIYKTKTIELGATANPVGSGNATAWNDNSKFTIPFYFSYARHMRKQLKFNDTDTYATNHNIFLVFQAIYADGSSTSVTPAEYHYSSRVEYEDA